METAASISEAAVFAVREIGSLWHIIVSVKTSGDLQ